MKVRTAGPQDLGTLAAIDAAARPKDEALDGPDFLDYISHKDCWVVLGETPAEGPVSFALFRGGDAGDYRVDHVATRPDAQRLGYASSVLRSIHKLARKRDRVAVTALVSERDDVAIALWRSLGAVGTLVKPPAEAPEGEPDAILFEWAAMTLELDCEG